MMPPLYFITDPDAPLPVPEQVLQAAQGGVRLIQLRDKTADNGSMISMARDLRAMLAPMGAKLIINDRIAVAVAAEADGLHIGQNDGDPHAARQAIGPGKLLGLSVEEPAHLAAIPNNCVDYIGAGPVRTTATKPDHAPPIGFDGLARISRSAPCPAYAIGGLGHGDCAQVKAAGAVGLAIVSAISRASDLTGATQDLIEEWNAA